MSVLLYSVGLVGASLAIHIIVWRISLPLFQTRALLVIFAVALVLGLSASWIGWLPRLSLGEMAHVALVQVSVALAYACLYSAIEGDSPSAALVKCTAEAGERGATLDDYRAIINDDLLIGSRFSAMLRDGLVVEKSGRYFLTSRGAKLARLFKLSSEILSLRESG